MVARAASALSHSMVSSSLVLEQRRRQLTQVGVVLDDQCRPSLRLCSARLRFVRMRLAHGLRPLASLARLFVGFCLLRLFVSFRLVFAGVCLLSSVTSCVSHFLQFSNERRQLFRNRFRNDVGKFGPQARRKETREPQLIEQRGGDDASRPALRQNLPSHSDEGSRSRNVNASAGALVQSAERYKN